MDTQRPEDLNLMLLHMAAAAAGVPERRARLVCSLRAALSLLEEEEPAARVTLTPEAQRALVELAAMLGMAAEHAEALAEHTVIASPQHLRQRSGRST